MATKKAGLVVYNSKLDKIALIFRDYYNDYSFPKGHVEQGETYEECAIRETAEEIKRQATIINHTPYIECYTTPKGEECEVYMYVALDTGHSDNTSIETHELIWVDVDRVEDTLSFQSNKEVWRALKKYIPCDNN